MNIVETTVFRGPNAWSVRYPKLIVLCVSASLDLSMQSLIQKGLKRIAPEFAAELSWGESLAKIALLLQRSAGAHCSFHSTAMSDEGHMAHVAFEYELEGVGLVVAQAAVRIMNAILENREPFMSSEIALVKGIAEHSGPDPLSSYLVKEAAQRDIPWLMVSEGPILQLGYGSKQKRLMKSSTEGTSVIGAKLAGNKYMTKLLLSSMGVPVPEGRLVQSIQDLPEALKRIGFPAVIKPCMGSKGRGVSVGIMEYEEAVAAFQTAGNIAEKTGVIIEKFVEGSDYRLLVVNYKFIAATKRLPPIVRGDGHSPLKALIHRINREPLRGPGHSKPLTELTVDDNLLLLLAKQGLTLDSILPMGVPLPLRSIANISTGGTTEDATDLVHPDNAFLAERIAKIVGLNICGLDILSPDISSPYYVNAASVVEVNSGPGIRLHMDPSQGLPRNVAASVLEMLFPDQAPSRIPIAAVSAMSDQQVCCALIADLWTRTGLRTGSATSRGIFIGHIPIRKDLLDPYKAAELLLRDPSVDAAVMEYSPLEILSKGLAFPYCDLGVVPDLGSHPTQALIRAASVIPASVTSSGCAVLNVDIDEIYNMHKLVIGTVAYISLVANNPRLVQHIQAGGHAAFLQDGVICLCQEKEKIDMASISPETAREASLGILSFVAAASAIKANISIIREILQEFIEKL